MIQAHEAAIAAVFVAVAAAGLFFTSWHAINLRPWRAAGVGIVTVAVVWVLSEAIGGLT